MKTLLRIVAGVFLCAAAPAWGQFVSGSDGTDGAFAPQSDVVVNLTSAQTGPWRTTEGDGNGVYDPSQWAVVFKYTTIDIPEGVTVTFINHRSGAPVVWLAQGDVTIAGVVNLDGADGVETPVRYAEPGPGGFAGGVPSSPQGNLSGGFGPGGAPNTNGSAGYGTLSSGIAYGNDTVLPLIGGSGGAGSTIGGGAGAGAILIASSTRIVLIEPDPPPAEAERIRANGGAGGAGTGSGGGIRLIANEISGNGAIYAVPGVRTRGTGLGRVRIESFRREYTGETVPLASIGEPGRVFPDAADPSLRVTMVNGMPVPQDPQARIRTPDVRIRPEDGDVVIFQIEARNVDIDGGELRVVLRFVGGHIFARSVNSTFLVGSRALSTATAQINRASIRGFSEIQLRLVLPE